MKLNLRKHFSDTVITGGLSLFYAVTRLTNLTGLPIFTDEAIYIRWSQIGASDANWRFISLTDGKQPLFTWIMMGLLKIIPDPLFAGRMVSVLAGAASCIGLWILVKELFKNKKIAYITVALYLISPFSTVYDRMALYDSLSAAFAIWNLYLAVRLVRNPRLDLALIFGMALGAGMLNKTSGFLSLYLLPLTLLLFDWKSKKLQSRLLQWGIFVVIAAGISQAMYGVLRLSPFFHMIGQKDAVFVYPLREWLTHPFLFFRGNMNGLFDWAISYLSWPVFLIALVPLFWPRQWLREKLLLYGMWLAPLCALGLFGRILYPRYILFMIMPLFVLAAMTVYEILRKYGRQVIGIVALFIIVAPSISTSYVFITNPRYAPIPFADRGQFIDDWPSGWGVAEVNEYLRKEAEKGHISVFTEGTFGLMPYSVEIALVTNPNVTIKGIWPLPEELPAEVMEKVKSEPIYMILNETQEAPPAWHMELLATYQKGTRQDRALRLFRVHLPVATRYE